MLIPAGFRCLNLQRPFPRGPREESALQEEVQPSDVRPRGFISAASRVKN